MPKVPQKLKALKNKKIQFLQNLKIQLLYFINVDQLKSAVCYFLRSTSTAAFFSIGSRQPFSSRPFKVLFIAKVFPELRALHESF